MRKALVLLAILAFSVGAFAADEYKIDKSHSKVGFSVRHMMLSTVDGRFTDFDGVIRYDEADPLKSSVDVTIKSASINTDSEGRDEHLRSADFFEAEKYPTITFKSKRIEKRGEGYVAIGDFTMKGVTKEMALPFTIVGKIKDQRGNSRIGVEADTKINRHDYGVAYNRLMEGGGAVVSGDVNIQLRIEATAPATAPAAK
jgi:polyisoprenoid-binding protein YceI